jgi:RNA polymerase sigma-70 factor, ECF subfamily
MTGRLDPESQRWLSDLRGRGAVHDDAMGRLHALLLRAARFEVARWRQAHRHLRGDELDDIATEAADDAFVSVLRRLDDFRGLSRFTTWADKFAVLEAAVKLRRRAWQGREVPLEPKPWDSSPAHSTRRTTTPSRRSCSGPCARESTARSRRTSGRCSSGWR